MAFSKPLDTFPLLWPDPNANYKKEANFANI